MVEFGGVSPVTFLKHSVTINPRFMPTVGWEHASLNNDSVRLRTLTLIRWVAIVGQALTLLVVHFGFGFQVPLVSALRETSIIFALLIGSLFLKEKFTFFKTTAVLTIFFGVILLKFF